VPEKSRNDSSQESWNREDKTLYHVIRTLSCIYFAATLPFRIAFLPSFQINFQEYGAFIILDCISTIVFVIDACQSFLFRRMSLMHAVQVSPMEFTGNEDGNAGSVLEMNHGIIRSPIALLLLSTAACLPLEYFSLVTKCEDGIVILLMLNRVILIMRLPSYIEDLAIYLEARGLKNIGIQRAWKLFFAMAIAGHWCCCGFFYVGKLEAVNGGDLSWPEELGIFERRGIESGNQSIVMIESVISAYIQSLYWAYITMVSTLLEAIEFGRFFNDDNVLLTGCNHPI